jgi:hypothetical protein
MSPALTEALLPVPSRTCVYASPKRDRKSRKEISRSSSNKQRNPTETNMTFNKAVTGFVLAAALGLIATSASAENYRKERPSARESRAQATYRTASDRAPSHCRTDNGYGRFDTCDH